MKSRCLFLLVYLLGCCHGWSAQTGNATCAAGEACVPVSDPTAPFLQCVGLHPTDTGKDHMRNLRGLMEAAMDIYTFMRSSMTGVPFLSLQGALEMHPEADPLQNEFLVQMWLDVKIKPLLSSITRHFLACLSTRTFSCSTYQIIVRELSHHFSEMDPVRQQWIYTFFMYPFLSGESVQGCVEPDENSEEWLMKNFGSFRAMARMEDFSAINMVFSGLEVLHLLSPAQKAELLLRPEVAGLENGTLTLVLQSLLMGEPGPHPVTVPGSGRNWTGDHEYGSDHDPYLPASSHNSVREVLNGLSTAFKPLGSFVHGFVSLTQETDVSEMRSTTLAQFVLNWTLAELADMYRPPDTPVTTEMPRFDAGNVADWYRRVVVPLLRRFLPEEALMDEKIMLAFHQVFYLDHTVDNDTSEVLDVCSISLDQRPCGLTDAVANVAHILHCAAQTNLTMTETTVMSLIVSLTGRLNSLIQELSGQNFSQLAADFQQIFSETDPPALAPEHLEDTDFIQLWFQIKLLPLLPAVPPSILSCLSTKNFSCPVYQTIVHDLGQHMSFAAVDHAHGHNIYTHFIHAFLLHHNTSDPHCVSSANHSAEWLEKNFGPFTMFASVVDLYDFNPTFSGLEVLHLLSPPQTAQLLLLPLPTPPEKPLVIDGVFDFLLEFPESRGFEPFLHAVVQLAREVNVSCGIYRQIFARLHQALASLPPDMEPYTRAHIQQLVETAPSECIPQNILCPATHVNVTHVCRGVDSSDLQAHLAASMDVPCNYSLEQYACAQLGNFTAQQLASLLTCDLPGNGNLSAAAWKMLLTRLSNILNPALDVLAVEAAAPLGVWAAPALDAIGELRLPLLTDEQLRNGSAAELWFSWRLRRFLPFASVTFLRCLSSRNLSCHAYRQILQVFVQQWDHMTPSQRHLVLKDFVLRFLSAPHSGPGCTSGFNNSADWLQANLGPFSSSLPLREILRLNPEFRPLEAVDLLTARQSAELVALPHAGPPSKDDVIHAVFNHLTQPDREGELTDFLSYLVAFLHPGSLSCASFRTLFDRLDLAATVVSLDVASNISSGREALSQHLPPGCSVYRGKCAITPLNQTAACVGVNSSVVQLLLDTGEAGSRLCDFGVEEFACASLANLTAEDLERLFRCERSPASAGSRPDWMLLLSKASHLLDEALDLLSDTTLDLGDPAAPIILDAINEIRLDVVPEASFNDPAFIQLWFGRRLRPFLPAVSPAFLSCLTARGLTCAAYQHILSILSSIRRDMTPPTMLSVYTRFIQVYLSRNDSADPTCSSHTNDSATWLRKNVGAFAALVSVRDLQALYSNFSVMEALPALTVRQLAEVSATPGQLSSPAQVAMVMRHVPDPLLVAFYDDFSPAIAGHESAFPADVRSAMLEVVFERANLSDPSAGDEVVLEWLRDRLGPLLFGLSPRHVAPFFRILAGRNCSIEQQGIDDLNRTISTLGEETQEEIHDHILQALREPTPLRCYGDNFDHSFYRFVERRFLSFRVPRLASFLSLMPKNKMHQLVNSMPPSDLGEYLRQPSVVDSDAALCEIFTNYIQTPMFLEEEHLPEAVRRPTLPCVWPMALASPSRSEADAWFDRRLQDYLPFLTERLLSPDAVHNATCLAFQRLVSVLGEYNFAAADFNRSDVYDTIRAYLTTESEPRCYRPDDPELNSTAWFALYIGPFLQFLTLKDLQMFGSTKDIQVFTVNLLNIQLLNHTDLPLDFVHFYTQLVYLQDGNFNPLHLPLLYRCTAPGPAFSQLSESESVVILHNLTSMCPDLDPQVAAALAGNLGDNIDATAIAALGNESVGISTGQIMMMAPEDLMKALGVLSGVEGWNEGQARAIVLALMSAGMMEINSAASLTMLGTLLGGVPAATFGGISGSQLLIAAADSSFMDNLLGAPAVIHQVFVTQIISVSDGSDMIVKNVPDGVAAEIPRALLLELSDGADVLETLNQKKWKQQQVELFFNVIALETATATLGGADNLSSSVLQGFTCTSVRTLKMVQIKKLIKACRRTGERRVNLVETQLTCMYNYIKGESDATSFDLYPPDVLLYYDYSLVPEASCRSYFQQLADADFSVFSAALSYKLTELFANARSCLGITGTSLTEDDVSVLGNMCCTLDASYIRDSDPAILEKLESCPDLNAAQAAAAEALLLTGNTQYGVPSTWNEMTLEALGMLPLYMTSTFYEHFDRETKKQFLKGFLKVLRDDGVDQERIKRLQAAIRESLKKKLKRSVDEECTVGEITQVTISADTFPFDYDDVAQFEHCLSAAVVKDNLYPITEKVAEDEYLRVVLTKLQEAYATGIPEEQVVLLGPASRVATVENINTWNITKIDTLAALMDTSGGQWDPNLAETVISKYLSADENSLGTLELNAVGGPNLCALDVDVLRSISPQSLKDANALTVSSCTLEKKRALFDIAVQAFRENTRSTISSNTYQMSRSYLGGATLDYVKTLSASDVNMDLETFASLDEDVVMALSVDEVKNLLGTQLAELKSYENQTLVQSWIRSQLQSDLDKLDLGLIGGRADPSTPAPANPPTPAATNKPATDKPATDKPATDKPATDKPATDKPATTMSSNGSHVRADVPLSFIFLLAVLVLPQHVVLV